MHAKLVAVGSEWVLQDLNSTNGTFLDGKRVTTPMTMRAGVEQAIKAKVPEIVGVEAIN